MEGISSLIPFPSTTNKGTKKSFGVRTVSLTKLRIDSLDRKRLFLLIGYIILVLSFKLKA
jgi:hypothetical protein